MSFAEIHGNVSRTRRHSKPSPTPGYPATKVHQTKGKANLVGNTCFSWGSAVLVLGGLLLRHVKIANLIATDVPSPTPSKQQIQSLRILRQSQHTCRQSPNATALGIWPTPRLSCNNSDQGQRVCISSTTPVVYPPGLPGRFLRRAWDLILPVALSNYTDCPSGQLHLGQIILLPPASSRTSFPRDLVV
jgi:hypothetical protein